MHLLLQTLGLLVLMPLAAIGPGLLVVGRLRWEPLEKFVAATAASLIIVYLCGFGLFVVAAPPWAYWAVMGAMATATLAQLPHVRALFRSTAVRLATAGYLALCSWLLLLLCLVRHFGGGAWAGDWVEHFQRTEVFLRLLPIDTRFLGLFTLPARPPMMNVIAAFFCRLCGMRDGRLQFTAFSLVFLLLNAWVLLPAMMLYRRFLAGRRRRLSGRAALLLTAVFMLNPFIAENATWTWTKLLCAGYVLLGIHLYLRSWRPEAEASAPPAPPRAGGYLVGSFLSLSAGLAVHFTAWPYIAVIGVHALWRQLRRRAEPPAQLAAAVATAAALSAVWFAWSVITFGVGGTFGAYFAAPAGPLEMAVPAWARVLQNLLFSILPQPPTSAELTAWFPGQASLNVLRDYWFEISQSNLLMMMGCMGGPIVLVLALRRLGRKVGRRTSAADRLRWWRWLVFGGAVMGICSTARVENFGAGMLCAPLVVMGLTFLAAQLPGISLVVRAAAVVGGAVDFALGIALHFWLQNGAFRATTADGQVRIYPAGFAQTEIGNWASKQMLHLIFWGDVAGPVARGLLGMMILVAMVAVAAMGWALFSRAGRSPASAASRLAG
jgi:hypothetical protein